MLGDSLNSSIQVHKDDSFSAIENIFIDFQMSTFLELRFVSLKCATIIKNLTHISLLYLSKLRVC
jgi:hypothetical protein